MTRQWKRMSASEAARVVVASRFQEAALPEFLKPMAMAMVENFHYRFFPDAGMVFAYARMFGYHNIPFLFAIGTLFFASWLAAEAMVILAYGSGAIKNRRGPNNLQLGPYFLVPPPGRERPHANSRPRLSILIWMVQAIAAFSFIVAASQRSSGGDVPGPWRAGSQFKAALIFCWTVCIAPASMGISSVGILMNEGITITSVLLAAISILAGFSVSIMVFYMTASVLSLPCILAFVILVSLAEAALDFWAGHDILAFQFKDHVRLWCARAGTLLILTCTVVYYAKLWSSTGTYKPSWAEHLP